MNAFNPSEFMAGYLGLGSYCFDASSILPQIDVDRILTEGQDSAVTKEQTADLAELIKTCYFEPEFPLSVQFDFANKETYGNIEKWHSDAEYIFPGQNATINCFFDDTSEEVGGRFDICQYRPELLGTKTDVEDMYSTYPKKFTIIVFNQNRNWLHKVVPSKAPRRMISFAAQFHDFNPVLPNLVQC